MKARRETVHFPYLTNELESWSVISGLRIMALVQSECTFCALLQLRRAKLEWRQTGSVILRDLVALYSSVDELSTAVGYGTRGYEYPTPTI